MTEKIALITAVDNLVEATYLLRLETYGTQGWEDRRIKHEKAYSNFIKLVSKVCDSNKINR